MKKITQYSAMLALLIMLASCGDLAIKTNTFDPDPDEGAGNESTADEADDDATASAPTQNHAVVFGSNFLDPVGSIATVGLFGSFLAQLNIVAPPPGSDAVLKVFKNILYIVNRFGAD